MLYELLSILMHKRKEIWHKWVRFYGLCSHRRKSYRSALLTPKCPASTLYIVGGESFSELLLRTLMAKICLKEWYAGHKIAFK
jgi:hypothetical protein